MPIFNYSFKKILLSKSSWILLIISTLMLGGIWFGFVYLSNLSILSNQLITVAYPNFIMFTFVIFVDILMFIFIAIKATQVFRDELDEGTLLILVSKPVSRTKIFWEKFLAFQAVMALFVIIVPLIASFSLLFIGNDIFYKSWIPHILIVIGILIILQIIFSSFAIFLSLIMNAKALIIVIMLIGIFSSIFSILGLSFLSPSSEYNNISQSLLISREFNQKLNAHDKAEFNILISNPHKVTEYEQDIIKFYNVVLGESGSKVTDLKLDPKLEQVNFQSLKNNRKSLIFSGLSDDDKNIDITLYNIFETMRLSDNVSYFQMLGSNLGSFSLNIFTLDKLAQTLHNVLINGIDEPTYKALKFDLLKQQIQNYLNPGYQWQYMLQLITTNSHERIFNPNLQNNLILDFNKTNKGSYVLANPNDMRPIMNALALFCIYSLLTIFSLIGVWYIFNHRDIV